ncbi:hypothetical protein MFFC18_07400 [Mariniblastus fucicola]|uniref:Uncharacterized protein n=1 Tax=Mariniblastus fucicola TaxID=980251 RepID=A0A5B9P5V6_9BACT|nr:hypothetical protein MFFC18_07400 [Mariniblastus fucicola]
MRRYVMFEIQVELDLLVIQGNSGCHLRYGSLETHVVVYN